ncbi:hypothetical protein [Sporosarcina sp. D27]|nr:hypothetical protein [Sporosarcina sp. D27]
MTDKLRDLIDNPDPVSDIQPVLSDNRITSLIMDGPLSEQAKRY